MSPSDPPTRISEPSVSKYAFDTHCWLTRPPPRSRAIAGSATLTIEPSTVATAEPRIAATSVRRCLRVMCEASGDTSDLFVSAHRFRVKPADIGEIIEDLLAALERMHPAAGASRVLILRGAGNSEVRGGAVYGRRRAGDT